MNGVYKLTACSYEEISQHTILFNLNQVEYWTWIQLPKGVLHDYELYEVNEFYPNNGEADWLHLVVRENCRPWLKICRDMLNLSIGKHIYQLKFVNRYTNDTVTYYFSYIIQNDNPERPYIYMDENR